MSFDDQQYAADLDLARDRIVELASTADSAIDMGGGDGAFAARLVAEKSCTVDVWEGNAKKREIAAARPGVTATDVDLSDYTEMPVEAGVEADLVVCVDTLDYLGAVGQDLVATTCERNRTPFYCVVPDGREQKVEDPVPRTTRTAAEWETWAQQYDEAPVVEQFGLAVLIRLFG